ncbi:MAG: lmo0937 family membrane protein [Bacteroidota bacterium]
MRSILYTIAVILVIAWALSSFAFHVTSSLIHILLVVAIIMILLNVIGGRRRPL